MAAATARRRSDACIVAGPLPYSLSDAIGRAVPSRRRPRRGDHHAAAAADPIADAVYFSSCDALARTAPD